MRRAKPFAGGPADPFHFIETPHVLAREPQPVCRLPASSTNLPVLRQSLLNRRRNFRSESRRRKLRARNEKILSENIRVGLKRHNASGISPELSVHRAHQAIAAQRNLRPQRLASDPPPAAQVKRIRQERRYPVGF